MDDADIFSLKNLYRVYLNELDQFVKYALKCRLYLRYVDDLVLLGNDRRELQDWKSGIKDFLAAHLKLELNMKGRMMASIHNGCNFLGYIVRPTHLTMRNRVVNNFRSKIEQYQFRLARRWKDAVVVHHKEKEIDRLHSILASYLGQFSHAAAH